MKLADKLAVIEKMMCPHLISKRAGDETYYLCELTERPSGRIKSCLAEHGDKCEIWEELREEDGD